MVSGQGSSRVTACRLSALTSGGAKIKRAQCHQCCILKTKRTKKSQQKIQKMYWQDTFISFYWDKLSFREFCLDEKLCKYNIEASNDRNDIFFWQFNIIRKDWQRSSMSLNVFTSLFHNAQNFPHLAPGTQIFCTYSRGAALGRDSKLEALIQQSLQLSMQTSVPQHWQDAELLTTIMFSMKTGSANPANCTLHSCTCR